MSKHLAVILASGSSSRMAGLSTLKPFLPLGTGTILSRSIQTFQESNLIDHVIVTVPLGQKDVYAKEIETYHFKDFVSVIEGGKIRQESSCKAVSSAASQGGAEILLIHDAARPFVTKQMIAELIKEAKEHQAAEVAIPVTDTIVREEGAFVKETLDRSTLYAVQTPQAFQFDLIHRAHQQALQDRFTDATDDIMLVERLGVKAKIVLGSKQNIKITFLEDYELAKVLCKDQSQFF